jgi:transposase InsO family protein
MSKEVEMLLQKSINEHLDLVIQHKMTVTAFSEHFDISRSWASELIRRKRNGEPLEKERGHRDEIFSESQKARIRKQYTDLMLSNGKMPSMNVLRECMRIDDGKFPEASIETYRKTVIELIEYPEKKNKKTYRKRFEAPSVGFIIQGDVTTHSWIDRANPFSLLLFIDDKSRYVMFADFIDSDNIENHKVAVKAWLKTFGKPAIVYYDNDPKYARGGYMRLLLERIGIRVINTKPYKPQGKGKLERKNGVFQDQLVHYIKLKKADTVDKAREVLRWYVDLHNRTYNRDIKSNPENVFKNSDDVFKYLTDKEWEDIELEFAIKEKRKVSSINEISIGGKYMLVPKLSNLPLSGRWVDIVVRSQYWIKVYYKNQYVTQYKWEDIYDQQNS